MSTETTTDTRWDDAHFREGRARRYELAAELVGDPAAWAFLVTPRPIARRILRRYQGLAGGWACMPKQRHEAVVVLDGEVSQPLEDHRRLFTATESEALSGVAIQAALWPTHCDNPHCPGTAELDGRPHWDGPHVFAADDPREVEHHRMGRREDTGAQVPLYRPPPGGIVEAWWMASHGADGKSLAIWTLDGWWYLDIEGRGGERFDRSGDGSQLTVVQTAGPAWRWSLKEGVLIDGGSGASPRGV